MEEPMEVPMEAPIITEQDIIQEVSLPIYQSRSWLKLLGFLNVITGAITALSIVGIIIAWLPIWLGIVLIKAGSSIEAAEEAGDKSALIESLNNLKTYFTIQGVLTLIGLILALLVICGMVVIFLAGIASTPELF